MKTYCIGTNKLIFFVIVFFSISKSIGQNVKGTITNESNEPVSDCYLLFIDYYTNEIIEYAIPNEKGQYNLSLDLGNISKIKLTCQGIAYLKETREISIDSLQASFINDFVLKKKEFNLDEVIVTAKRLKIQIKNDTIVYDVSKFRRINDLKIIDVLKNMPGIQVDEKTGVIRYKGKPIETLLLDGDDLFGKGYSIGARNISSEIVDKVEAIEDYHDNRLKKGIKSSDDVVLNLKLKKNTFKLSGEASLGLSQDNYLANVNSLNLLSKVKGFGVFNMNNISLNQTSFLNETYAIENSEEIESYGINFFKESNAAQIPNFPRSYVNQLKSGSYINLVKITKKLNLKNSVSFFNDKSNFGYNSKNEIVINNEDFLTTNETSNNSLPKYLVISNSLSYDINNSTIFKYDNRFVNNANTFTQTNIQNEARIFETELNNKKFFYNQNLNFTRKISNSELVELNIYHSDDSNRQDLKIQNNEAIIIDGQLFDKENLISKRQMTNLQASYFKKLNNFDYQFKLKNEYDSENFSIEINDQKFNYNYNNNTFLTNLEINYLKFEKFKATTSLEIGYSDRSLKNDFEDSLISAYDFIVNTDTKLKYKLSQNSNLSFNIKNKNKQIDHNYLFSNSVLLDTRTIVKNNSTLQFEKNWYTSLNFTNYNILKQSNFSFLLSYKEAKNTFLAEQSINENTSLITYFQTPLTVKDINLSTSQGFFVDIINNKISLNNNLSINQYYNSLNGNNINSVNSSIYNFNLELNSAFDGFFNYKSSFGFSYITNQQENSLTFINSNINARVESIFKIYKKAFFKLENELLLPRGTEQIKDQFFFDFSFNHINEKIEYFILAKNLLNQKAFTQIYTTEFSKSTFSNNLFSRYIIFGLNYKF